MEDYLCGVSLKVSRIYRADGVGGTNESLPELLILLCL